MTSDNERAIEALDGQKNATFLILSIEVRNTIRAALSQPDASGLVKALNDVFNGDARQTKKLEKCRHGKYGYEDCENCISEFCYDALTAYKQQTEGKDVG